MQSFEILKELDSQKILNNDCYLIMEAIEKTETMRLLSYYALTKIY